MGTPLGNRAVPVPICCKVNSAVCVDVIIGWTIGSRLQECQWSPCGTVYDAYLVKREADLVVWCSRSRVYLCHSCLRFTNDKRRWQVYLL